MKQHAASLAAALKSEPGLEVEQVDGAKGELTVLVDGAVVARKGESMPTVEQVRDAVRGRAAVGNAP